jgi:putative PIN family toxin of toxin-antitoxin system
MVELTFGRRVLENEAISIRAIEPPLLTDQRRPEQTAVREYFSAVDASRKPGSAEEAGEILTEAIRKLPRRLSPASVKIVPDTTILVRATERSHGLARELLMNIVAGEHTLLLSNEMLHELARVMRYPRLREFYGLTEDLVFDYVTFLRQSSEIVTLDPAMSAPIRDVNDIIVMQTAIISTTSRGCIVYAPERAFLLARMVELFPAQKPLKPCEHVGLSDRLRQIRKLPFQPIHVHLSPMTADERGGVRQVLGSVGNEFQEEQVVERGHTHRGSCNAAHHRVFDGLPFERPRGKQQVDGNSVRSLNRQHASTPRKLQRLLRACHQPRRQCGDRGLKLVRFNPERQVHV